MQHQHRLDRAVEYPVDGASRKDPVNKVVVVFHDANDIRLAALDKTEDAVGRIGFRDIVERQFGTGNDFP